MRRWLSSDRGVAAGMVALSLCLAAFAVVVVLAFQWSQDAARDAQHAVREIQASRLDLCQQQNARHDATITTLDREIGQLPARERRRAARNRRSTVALLEALAPRRDCARVLGPSL